MTSDSRLADCRARTTEIRAEYPFEPHVFDVDGTWMHYVDHGPVQGGPRGDEAILFVHGNPTWSFAFRHLISAHSIEHRCIAVDHVGCGLSDKPADYDYTLERHAENLTALVDHLGLRRVLLVLHDWGGAIGMGFARRRPGLVQAIAVMNTGAFRSKHMPLRIAACRWPGIGPLFVRGFNAFSRGALTMAVEKPLSDVAKRGYLLPYASWNERVAVQSFVEDIPTKPDDRSYAELVEIEKALPSFKGRPTAAFWGMKDWCFTPEFLHGFLDRWPDMEVTCYEDAGHYLFEDERSALGKRLAGWIHRTALPKL